MEPATSDSHQQRAQLSHLPRKKPANGTATPQATRKERRSLLSVFKILGPGLITGASDDDPSGIGTYTTAGASLGYSTLWTALITFPLMTVVEYLCAKVGMVSGKGLA